MAELLEPALAGEGSLVLVSGEAGIGKTRLMDELAASTEAAVLRGAASHDATPAYGPVVAALRSHLRARPRTGSTTAGRSATTCGALLPELGPPPGRRRRGHPARGDPLRARRGRGRRAAPLVVLDDLQWSDAATLELLAELAPTLAELPLLVVGAYRSDELAARAPAAPPAQRAAPRPRA